MKRYFIMLFVLLSVFNSRLVFAESLGFIFEKNLTYDIYFDAAFDDGSVLQNVEILRFEEFAGRTFLVVRSKGFKLNEADGFILLDSITAILPDRNFKVSKVTASVKR